MPQKSERTYIVGILNYKPIDNKKDNRNKVIDNLKKTFDYNGFDFFQSLTFNNQQKYIIDILENSKDKKYLIQNEEVSRFLNENNFNESNLCEKRIIKLFDLPRNVWNDLDRQRRVYSIYGISPTILARSDTAKIYINKINEKYVRKFTPRENFRLQGFDDSFIDNILKTVSMTQQYKQAGNAVCPPVITGIVNHLQKFMEDEI